MDFSSFPWLIAILGGAVALGIAIAYGIRKSDRASRRQVDTAERGAREQYHKDESKD